MRRVSSGRREGGCGGDECDVSIDKREDFRDTAISGKETFFLSMNLIMKWRKQLTPPLFLYLHFSLFVKY